MKREHPRIPGPAMDPFARHGEHPHKSAVRQAGHRAMQTAGAACMALASSLTWAADGGVGIVATGGAHVTVCSTVSGGLAGDGSTQAAAVQFTGGGNMLTLQVGHAFVGAVMGGAGATRWHWAAAATRPALAPPMAVSTSAPSAARSMALAPWPRRGPAPGR